MIGQTISHYQLLQKLGEGGMGEVYLAEDTILGRKVALKFLPEIMQKDPVAQKRFLQEAKAAAGLDHPYICHIHEIGEAEGKQFIVMEYVAGENLMDLLQKGSLPLKQTLRIALEVAEALEVAHLQNIVHRDLKPANIMLNPQGHAKVMDFGLAKQVAPLEDAHSQVQTLTAATQQGSILGTVAYMSPEQARGEAVDARSDIFSFGILLYEMASGQHPFRRPSATETMTCILRDSPPPLQKVVRKPPPALDQILTKALAKDRSQRYQKMQDLTSDLRSVWERVVPAAWFTPLRLTAAFLLLLVLTTVWWWWTRPAPGPPADARLHEPVSVLLADFKNETGEAIFDQVLEQAMAIGLEGAPFITSYDRGRARKSAEQIKAGTTALGEDMARLVAQRDGINIIIAGSIGRQGDSYKISARAIDPGTGKSLLQEENVVRSKDEVLTAVGKLSARVRTALGDTTPESSQQSTETFTAASLEAAQNYARGQELQGQGQWEKAIPFYAKAIELDQSFGRAYAGLAVMHRNLGHSEEAGKHYEQAVAYLDRMTDREKYRTRGGYYVTVRNFPKAIDEFKALVEQYPADFVGHNNLALAYFLGRNMPQALEEGRKAVAIYPKNAVMRSNLALYAMYSGDFQTALNEAEGILKTDPSSESAHLCLALSLLGEGQSEKAVAVYRRLQNLSPAGASLAGGGLADLALAQGNFSEAQAILEKDLATDKQRSDTEAVARKSLMLGSVALALRQPQLAIRAADQALSSTAIDPVIYSASLLYLEADRAEKAAALAAQLSKNLNTEPRLYAKLIQGEIELRKGQTQQALKLFQDAKSLTDAWLARFALGRAYLQAGAFTEAHSEFETCFKRRGEAVAVFLDDYPSYSYFPPVHYYLGRAQEGLKSAAAADSYRTFLSFRKESIDALAVDARRRLDSLAQ